MTTLLYTHAACLEHDPGQYHPERPARLRAVLDALAAPEFAALDRREAPQAASDDLTRVHPPRFVERLLAAVPQAGHVGTEGAAAGSTAGVDGTVPKGVSPIDAAVASARAAVVGAQQGWQTVVAAASGQQAAGGGDGVTGLSRTEAENAVRLGEVGEEAASEPAVWI